MKDSEFAALWASGRVLECSGGIKYFQHPLVGEFSAEFYVWLQSDSPNHRLEVYTATDQQSADTLTLLRSLTNSHNEVPDA